MGGIAIAGGVDWSWRVAMEDEYIGLICGGPVTWDTWESARGTLVGAANSGGH
jgi:hypothetical protein